MYRHLCGLGVAMLASASAAGLARGQSAPSPITLPTVSVTAPTLGAGFLPPPYDASAHAVGQTVTTIDPALTADQPAFQIGDTLRYAPGISLKQGNGPRDQGISIRGSNARNGFGIRNIQVYEDGFPVTQPDGLSRTDITDPHAYGDIDVYRGPSSAMFGNYATGGAINFHMRPGGAIQGIEIGSDAGSFGYVNEYGVFGGQDDNTEATGLVSHVRGEGFQPNQGFSTTTGDILASYRLTDADKLTVKLIENYVGAALPVRLSLNQFHRNPFQQGCPFINAATTAAGCAGVNLFVNGVSGPTVAQTPSQAGLGRHDLRSIGGGRWEHDFDADTVWRVQLVYDNKDINQPTGTTSAVGDQPAFNLLTDLTRHGTLLGMEATHFAQFSFNTVHIANDTYNVAPGGGARLGALTAANYGTQSNLGGRVREEVRLLPQVVGEIGFGVETTDLDATDLIYAYPAAGGAPTVSTIAVARNFLNTAPEASLRYRPSEAWQLRGRIGTGYGTPQAGNLFVTPAGVPGNNTQLKTQSNVGGDLGADWTPSPDLSISATGFYESFHDELVSQSPGAGLQSFTFNVPRSEHHGAEVAADWRPAPGWRATLAYLHDDQFYQQYTEQLSAGTKTASFNRAGNRIPGVEPNNLLVRIGYDQPSGPLAGLGGFVETYWRDSYFLDNANLIKAPAYAIVNLNIHYDPGVALAYTQGIMLFLSVQNLFDKTYAASANNVSDSLDATTGLQNNAAVIANSGGSIYAGAPCTVIGGIKVKF
ncbi:MAG TPA: TonB-dependent receptor [Stellaceae bacterium]|nr:TonB-dependent receptor [Stellaceae bacterium]